MFGMGGSEMIVILIVALIFLGPDKLPEATKAISKGIRDLKKQSRILQQQIENDEHIGGALRDLKSALRGDELPVRPPKKKPEKKQLIEGDTEEDLEAEELEPVETAQKPAAVTLPPTAGEADPGAPGATAEELAPLIKPPSGTIAKGGDKPAEPKNGQS